MSLDSIVHAFIAARRSCFLTLSGWISTALIESVDAVRERRDAETAWSFEARRRLHEVRLGVVRPVPWEEAERRIFDPDPTTTVLLMAGRLVPSGNHYAFERESFLAKVLELAEAETSA